MITCIVINTHYHLLYGSTENEKNTIVNNESPIDKIIKMALSLGQKIEMKDNKLIIE